MSDPLAIQMTPGFDSSKPVSSEPQIEEGYILTPEQQRHIDLARITDEDAYQYAFRRYSQWRETYGMYRGNIVIDRLLQRQSVHIPVMKYSIKTILKDVDDPPMLYFKNRDNDAQKELFYNEYWKEVGVRDNHLLVKDLIDKKQALLYGRTYKKLNIRDGKFYFEIVDPQDIRINRYVDPADLDSANDLHHKHIFRTLSSLSNNPLYDKAVIKQLQEFYATQTGLIKAEETAQTLEEKNQRLKDLGDLDTDNPQLGEIYVELTEHYVKIFDKTKNRNIIWLIVSVDGKMLCDKPLHEIIGKTTDDFWYDHFPFTSWGEDPERTDFLSDGPGDILCNMNKIVDVWASQLVENRTLRNLGMHFYNSDLEGFVPQSYDIAAGGFYPLPLGKKGEIDINKVMMRVDIPELSESLDEISFFLTMAEKASGATATQQGMTTKDVLLGDIKLALQNAQERTKGMTALYTESWEDFGLKYTKLMEAAGDMIDAVKVFRKGLNTDKLYSADISPKDWRSKLGYQCEVKDLSQNASEQTDELQKLNAAKQIMPNNIPLDEIYKQKVLEFARLDANEIQKVMDFEKNPPIAPVVPQLGPGGGPSLTPGGPGGMNKPVVTPPAVA